MGVKIVDFNIAVAAFQQLVSNDLRLNDLTGDGYIKLLSVAFDRERDIRALFAAYTLLCALHTKLRYGFVLNGNNQIPDL